MELAFITPTYYLEQFAKQGPILLALAHLIDDRGENQYAKFHRREAEKGHRVILDNGLFEGAQVSTDSLLRRTEAIRASVVCAPDVLYDSQGTVKAFKQFIKAKQEYGLVADVMGIPQADNPNDWWECFRFMELSKECQLVGLSILSIPQSFKTFARTSEPITSSRCFIIRQLHSYENLIGRRIKSCHLLGLGESYADIILASRVLPNTIISNDSSSAFVHGANGKRYSKLGTWSGGKEHKKLDFGINSLEKQQEQHIEYNIQTALEISTREWS